METSTKHKLYIISAAVAAGCTFSYFILITRKRIHLDAMDMFNYLNIKIATTEECCDQIVAELRGRCQQYKALGFDCEWVTDKGKKKPVALVQLSSMDGLCGLFRLNCVKTMPQSLKTLLEDKSIYKVGVAVTDDSRYLKQDYLVTLESALDLRHLAKLVGYDTGGLASLSKTLLGVILDKSWRVRCSNWEAETLSQKQSQYAATDAHVAIKIFAILIKQLYSQDSTFSWLQMMWNKDCVWSSVDKYCSKYSDINFKSKPNGAKLKLDLNGKDTKVNKENRRYPNATRSKPLYHNCFLQAPDGEVLCTCDNKKALWYVQKELADVVSQEPLAVRLRFEPAGRSVGEVGRYYQLTKENKCVICGGTNSYIRKNVVPREYRKYFPEVMKDHSSHDVVLLCTECHRRSNVRDQAMRERLAALCYAPLPTHRHTKYSEDAICKKIKSAARALLYQTQKHVLPDARRKELEDILLQYYPLQDQITNELLQEAAELQVMFENDNYESHGLKVVEYFLEHEGLLRLEQIWRQHFLDCMQPKYMPALWSVTHNDERLRVKWNEGRLTERDLKSIGLTTWVA